MYTASLAHATEILRTPIDWGHRSARLEEARRSGLMDYLRGVSASGAERVPDRDARLERLVRESSLKAIAPGLRDDPRVFLMHNADDFLVSREDLEFAEAGFGDRATIYPHGGHLGNLWHPRNRRDILSVFEPLRHGR